MPYIGAPANIYRAYVQRYDEGAPHKDRLVACKVDKKAGPTGHNVYTGHGMVKAHD